MTISFVLPVGAFSINRMSSRDLRFKTPAYKDFATQVLYVLEQVDALKVMGELHAAKGGEFTVELTATYPPQLFRNKQGEISSRSIDCSNFEKPILDLIFGDTMGVNDRHVTCLISKKRAGARLSIECTISLISPISSC